MARISFRQGIVRHQTDINDNPIFLSVSGGYVSLIVSPDPTTLAFVHGTSDYSYTEFHTETDAWGPFSAGTDYWLYWELNMATGLRTFGSTIYEPTFEPTAPGSPLTGQMWFNTITNLWYEYTGSLWLEVIRVFSCKLAAGTTTVSMSIDSPLYTGTQAGLTTETDIGSLVYGMDGIPLKNDNNQKFFTTEDPFTTGVPSGASLKINNIIVRAQAFEPIAAYHVVEFFDYNTIIAAQAFNSIGKIYGIMEEDVVTNEVVNFVTDGIIFNEQWDWVTAGGSINSLLYNDNTGAISLTETVPNQMAIGAVIDAQTILFKPGFAVQGPDNNPFPSHGELVGLDDDDHIQYHTDTRGDARYYLKSAVDTSLAGKSDTGHTHVVADITDFAHIHGINEVTNLQTELDNRVKIDTDTTLGTNVDITFDGGEVLGLPATPSVGDAAASKIYVDTKILGIVWLEPVCDCCLLAIDIDTPPAAPSTKSTFIVGTTPTGVWAGITPGTAVQWDGVAWIQVLSPVVIGSRFMIAAGDNVGYPPQYFIDNPGTPLLAHAGKIVEITDATPGVITYSLQTPIDNDAVFTKCSLSASFGDSFVFSGTWGTGVYPTDYSWVLFDSGRQLTAGTNITIDSNAINVSPQGTGSSLDADLWDGQQTNITSLLTDQTLQYDGVDWVNDYGRHIRDDNDTAYVDVANAGGKITIQPGPSGGALSIEKPNSQNASGGIQLADALALGSQHYIKLIAAPAIAADFTLILPADAGTINQFLQTDGTDTLAWTSVSEVPAGTSSCQVLGYDGASWVARSPIELPRPYDISAQTFGTVATSAIIMKFLSPTAFKLSDYGHQAHCEGNGGGSGSYNDFEIRLGSTTGTLLGTVGFTQDNNANPSISITETDIVVGDLIYIVSPAIVDASVVDLNIVLTGTVMPILPDCDPITVTFDQAIYTEGVDFTSGVALTGGTLAITGTWNYLEWTVLQISRDDTNYYPMDGGFRSGVATGDKAVNFVFSDVGAIPVATNSAYAQSKDMLPSLADAGTVGNTQYVVKVTAFGPAGIASDTATFKF